MSDCSVDHASLKVKFCPSCGLKRIDKGRLCPQGHEMSIKAKFCPVCGSELLSLSNVCINGHVISSQAKFCNICGDQASIAKQPSKPLSNQNRRIEPRSSETPSQLAQVFQQPVLGQSQNFPNEVQFSRQDYGGNKKSNKNFVIGGISALVLLLFGIVMLGTSNSGSSPVTVTVQMVLSDQYDCFDISWGYSDIPGGQVVLDVDGTKYFGSYPALGESSGSGCKFTAFIQGVNSEGVNYAISMASGRRGTIYNSKSELEANDWTFFLSLG